MGSLLLAPYNDSMRLGQGYNSFMQTLCIDNAVQVGPSEKGKNDTRSGPSQVVSYSSRLVSKISDVVRSMNISAGHSIKTGSIEVSGNSMSVDELKFAESDLNAVVSVKVINQTTLEAPENITFKPLEKVKFFEDSKKFHEVYGDCFISGFIEGGDLHGIISMKVLDASKKDEVQKLIKGQINSASGEFTLSDQGAFSSAIKQTETTITVNWSGGGQIKEPNDGWDLETLFSVAAGFPAKVAECPQRTWAILTRYDNNRDFVQWADENNIKLRRYNNVQRYTADLLDMYMDYKSNLALLHDVMSRPDEYTKSKAKNPVEVAIENLLEEKKLIKAQMASIVKEIDELNADPGNLTVIESKSTIKSPELWATRLPILKDSDSDGTTLLENAQLILGNLPFADAVVKETPKARKNPMIGTFNTSEVRAWEQPNPRNAKPVTFATPFSIPPTGIPMGLNSIDVPKTNYIRIGCSDSEITANGFKPRIDSWADSTIVSAGCAWMEIAPDDPDFQFGKFSTREDHGTDKPQLITTRQITFKRPYSAPPKVVVWLSMIDMANTKIWRVKTFASNITPTGFTLSINSWADTILCSAEAQWVAYPADKPNILSGSFNTLPQVTTGALSFGGTFTTTPRVFAAFDTIDVDNNHSLRLTIECSNLTPNGMNWGLKTWSETVVYGAGASYIVMG